MASAEVVAWVFLAYLFIPVAAYFAWVLYGFLRRRGKQKAQDAAENEA